MRTCDNCRWQEEIVVGKFCCTFEAKVVILGQQAKCEYPECPVCRIACEKWAPETFKKETP